MAIPESQLDTWSHQGSTVQSAATYRTVQTALQAADTKYASQDFEVFLQGSYCNDTNVYAESDVDVVICLNSCFFYDISTLNPQEQVRLSSSWSDPTYSYELFRADVLKVLQRRFESVSVGKRAINIGAVGNRRSVDVVIAAEFHQYEPGNPTLQVERGIGFLSSEGKRIVNYPKQHSDNCTKKHADTKGYFKPMVRILKNMRNVMIERGVLGKGSAPSYFIEGLLFNVPPEKFGASYGQSFAASFNWIRKADLTTFTCPNGMYYLYRDGAPECWPCRDCNNFVDRVVDFWNNWS